RRMRRSTWSKSAPRRTRRRMLLPGRDTALLPRRMMALGAGGGGGPAAALLRSCAFLLEPLQDRLHDERPGDRRVGIDLGVATAFGRRNELAPGHALAIGAAGEPTPMRRLG